MNNEEKILEMLTALTERMDRIDDRSLRTMMLIENEITPKLNLLYEGHETILNQMAPKSRVEALEDEVALLKDAFKLMRQEVEQLKQAQ